MTQAEAIEAALADDLVELFEVHVFGPLDHPRTDARSCLRPGDEGVIVHRKSDGLHEEGALVCLDCGYTTEAPI